MTARTNNFPCPRVFVSFQCHCGYILSIVLQTIIMSSLGASRVIASHFDSFAKKDAQYREGTDKNQSYTKVTAARLVMPGGDVPSAVSIVSKDDVPIVDVSELNEFIKEQRERLKKLAAKNVEVSHKLDDFHTACQELQRQELTNESVDVSGEKDYTVILSNMMESAKNKRKVTQLELHQEKYMMEVMEAMGEKTGEEDEDIEMVGGTATQAANLKCPITGTWMSDSIMCFVIKCLEPARLNYYSCRCTAMMLEDPVKNKVCGHYYSRAAIMSYIQNKRRENRNCFCPVSGCGNETITEQQFVKDPYIERLVHRESQKQSNATRSRSQHAEELVDTDDEGEF